LTVLATQSIVVSMDSLEQAGKDLERLEQQLQNLLDQCRKLREENLSLQNRQESLVAERASLVSKNEDARTKVEAMIEANPGGEEVLINILHAIQGEFGYVPKEALILISQRKDIFLSKLYRLVTAYAAFRIEEPGKHIITLCDGTSCHVKGGNSLLKEVEAKVAGNGTDVTVEKVRCLGCCDLSPAVMIDGEIYTGADAQAKLAAILN